jgi:hypothetical protein
MDAVDQLRKYLRKNSLEKLKAIIGKFKEINTYDLQDRTIERHRALEAEIAALKVKLAQQTNNPLRAEISALLTEYYRICV